MMLVAVPIGSNNIYQEKESAISSSLERKGLRSRMTPWLELIFMHNTETPSSSHLYLHETDYFDGNTPHWRDPGFELLR